MRRSKTLASKFSRLYYSIFYAFCKRIRPAVKILEFTHHLEKQSFYFYLSTCICNRGVCLLRHNFMDVHNISVLALKKCMNRIETYTFRCFIVFLH